MLHELTDIEARVIGCLIEKSITTPDLYPLTLNALLFGPLLGSLAQFPAKIRARALPPVHFDEPPDLEHYPRSLLMDHAETIRGQLQTALNQMLQKRESIVRG